MFGANEEIGETLTKESLKIEEPSRKNRKIKIIIIVVISLLVIAGLAVGIYFAVRKNNETPQPKPEPDPTSKPEPEPTSKPEPEPEIKVNINTIPLPDDIIIDDGHYLYDGNIFINYKKNTTNFTYFGVISDDGSNFTELYGAEFIVDSKANGIRVIPFRDNKRVYLGDFVFECKDNTKTISECKEGVLIPVNYPETVVNNSFTYKTWSEMVVAPDNVHVAWTSLNMACGAVNFLGKFKREENSYEIIDTKIISTINFIEEDKTNSTILIPKTPRGGEIKQFIEGGNALSLVGTLPNEFVKSVYQSLTSEDHYYFSHEIGYDETSILSPDEKLGISMSTRFSPNTSMGILGLMPRPYVSLVLSQIVADVYNYAVAGVRNGRKGNIGPVLFEKEKSMKDPNYHGIDLHDKEEKYVFCSPISWHPSNLKALWPEVEKGTKNRRLRRLNINNYTPSPYPKIVNTTDDVPYALDMSEFEKITFQKEINGVIKGKNSGEIEYYNSGFSTTKQTVKLTYKNYSDDGKKFFNGEEIYEGITNVKNVYSSNVALSGSETGQNNFKITFDKDSKLMKNESEGFATYGGKTIKAEDYEE